MKKIIVGALVTFGLTGCLDYQFQDRTQWLVYTQDNRTHLCYAMMRFDRSMSVTNVPCTGEVIEQIKITITQEHHKVNSMDIRNQ